MPICKRFLFLHALLVLSCMNTVPAQNLSFRHLTSSDGLSSELIRAITEDKIGRLWIGTDDGLNVFDGYTIQTFFKEDLTGLTSDYITKLFCDTAGRLWIGTDKGLNLLSKNGRKFIVPVVKSNHTISGCYHIRQTGSCGMVFSTPEGYYYFDEENKMLTPLEWLNKILKPELSRLVTGSKVANDQFIMIADDRFVVVDFVFKKILFSWQDRDVRSVIYCGGDDLLVGKFNNPVLYRVNMQTDSITDYTNSVDQYGKKISPFIAGMDFYDKNKIVLASRYNGIYLYDINTEKFINYAHEPANSSSLKSNYTRYVYSSPRGNIFVATAPLSYCSIPTSGFQTITYFKDKQGVINDDVVNCFAKDAQGCMWIGTNASLVKWNPQTNLSEYFYYIPQSDDEIRINTIRGVTVDKKGRIWVATYGGGIGLLDIRKRSFMKFTYDPAKGEKTIPDNSVSSIQCDKKGFLWATTNRGFCRINPDNFEINNFSTDPVLAPLIKKNINTIFTDSKENLWIGTDNGAWYFQKEYDSLTHFKFEETGKANTVYSFTEDREGKIYAGTGNGLFKLNALSGTILKSYDNNHGLLVNTILGLLTDSSGAIWISGGRGIARLSPSTDKIDLFGVKDGVLMSDHKQQAYYRAADDEMVMGGQGGFNYFFPKEIESRPYPIPTSITEVLLNDSTIALSGDIILTLEHRQRNISFHYLAMDYQVTPFIQYQYRLQGFDTAWVNSGKQREVRYVNLPARNYTFMVRSSTDGRTWSPANNTVQLKILPALWQRWWFIVLCVTFTCGVIYFFLKTRIRNIHRKAELQKDFEKKIAQVKMNMLRAQMNPHFIFNSLNSINNFILKNDMRNASGYLTKFSRLMRMILDNSRSEWVTLESELNAINLYVQLESLRFDNAFSFHLHTGEDVNTGQVIVPPLIIQPYIENAIWHGLLYKEEPGGLLQLNIRREEGKLLIRVEDNGVGRKAAEEMRSKSALKRNSHGMKITGERLGIVNTTYAVNAEVDVTDLYDAGQKACGTRVLIILSYIQHKMA